MLPAKRLPNHDELIAWLKTKPLDEEYVWQDPVYCLMGKYLADHEARWGDVIYSEMPDYFLIAGSKPWTFGAALERAESLRAESLRAEKENLKTLAPVLAPIVNTDTRDLAQLEGQRLALTSSVEVLE